MQKTLVISTLLACASGAFAAGPEFHDSIEIARASTEQPLPIVVSFGASWCGWCQKMKVDTFASDELNELAKSFLWVKIDIDEEKSLAARYGVRGVPHTAVLNEKDQLLGGRAGYMTAAELIEFVNDALKNPPQLDIVAELLAKFDTATNDEALRTATKGLLDSLAGSERADRQRIVDAIAKKGPSVWPLLVELLADRRLAVRAAAGDTLAALTKARLAFHPFARADVRQQQVAAWSQWVAAASNQ